MLLQSVVTVKECRTFSLAFGCGTYIIIYYPVCGRRKFNIYSSMHLFFRNIKRISLLLKLYFNAKHCEGYGFTRFCVKLLLDVTAS